MKSNSDADLNLRAHHIHCTNFLKIDLRDRGPDFLKAAAATSSAIRRDLDKTIRIIEGTDELCLACPMCKSGRCESPKGDEEEVRKWDTLVLRGLGLKAGDTVTVHRLWQIIREKSPIPLCQRCQWRDSCQYPR